MWVALANFPATHAVQEPAPAAEDVPTGQSVQLVAAEPEYVPAAHCEQVEVPADVPAVQVEQVFEPGCATEPLAQAWHDVAPALAAKVSAGHGVQLGSSSVDV